VRVTSDTQKIQSSDLPKWRCTLWPNVNARVLSGIGCHFKRFVDTLIDLSTACFSDHDNWRIDSPLVGPSEMTLGSTKCRKLRYGINHHVSLANQNTKSFVFSGYAYMQCLASRAFPHMSEHRTSFQAFCRYINWPSLTLNILDTLLHWLAFPTQHFYLVSTGICPYPLKFDRNRFL